MSVNHNLVESNALEACSKFDVKCVHALFCVYKSEELSRAIYDMSPLTNFKGYNPPEFTLPSFRKVLKECSVTDVAIKIDLKSGFYHLPPAFQCEVLREIL